MVVRKNPVLWAGIIFISALILHRLNQSAETSVETIPAKPKVTFEVKTSEKSARELEGISTSTDLKDHSPLSKLSTSPAGGQAGESVLGGAHGEKKTGQLNREEEILRGYLAKSISSRSPSILSLRREIRQSPHEPPSSYLSFAMQMTTMVDLSMKSASSARAMFRHLRECVETDPETMSGLVRLHCLRETQRMGAARSDLRPEFKDLAQKLRTSDRQFLKSFGKMRVTRDNESAG